MEGEGTRVREGAASAGRDTVLPLAGAVATSLLEGLGAGPRTLLVGGVADLVYLEDLFGDAFYLHLLAATGTEGLDPEELAGEGSVVRRVERATGTAVDRYRPARYLLDQQQQRLLPAMGREPLHRFARLFATLDEL